MIIEGLGAPPLPTELPTVAPSHTFRIMGYASGVDLLDRTQLQLGVGREDFLRSTLSALWSMRPVCFF